MTDTFITMRKKDPLTLLYPYLSIYLTLLYPYLPIPYHTYTLPYFTLTYLYLTIPIPLPTFTFHIYTYDEAYE